MNTQVTLCLPSELLQKAISWADFLGRPVDEFLAEAIEFSLLPLGPAADSKMINNWTDQAVLATIVEDLTASENARLRELLEKQQAGTIASSEKRDLQALMIVYQTKLLRKARALNEAVRRGLKEPLAFRTGSHWALNEAMRCKLQEPMQP